MKTSTRDLPSSGTSNKTLKLTSRTPTERDKHSKKKLKNGKSPVRTFKTCTLLPGNTKLLKAKLPQHPLKDQVPLNSKTHNKFLTTGDMPPKLTKILDKILKTISETSLNLFKHKETNLKVKLTTNGSHKLRKSTDLTLKLSKKLLLSIKVSPRKNSMNSIKMPEMLQLTSQI